MFSRLMVAVGLAGFAALYIMSSCSSKERRDQNYGTDAGADYSPEAGVFSRDTEAAETEDDAGDVTVSPDSAGPDNPDAAPESDASVNP